VKLPRLRKNRPLAIALSVAGTAAVMGLLAAAMVWTYFDPQWVPFLGGVLLAAVLATASRVMRAEWRLARRTRQLERARAQLAQESTRAHTASEAIRLGEERLRQLCDALPMPVFFVDRDARCHLHNAAAALEARRPREAIDGRPLADAVGQEAYAVMQPHLAASFAGRETRYALTWPGHAQGAPFEALHVPVPRGSAQPTGAFVIFDRGQPHPAAPAAAGPEEPHDVLHDLDFLRAHSHRASDWDEPHARLKRALEEDHFELLQQPIVRIAAGAPEPAFREIFLRLAEEEGNLLPPGSFFPVAEHFGMMEQIDRWVARQVVARCRGSAASRGAPGTLYALNLSQATVRSRDFARFVQDQLVEQYADGGALCFEIAEHEFVLCRNDVARLIGELKPLGCRFTADAFGSVKGSFAALRGLAFDYVKADGVLVLNMLRQASVRLRVSAIADVCRKAGMRSIAEFVEDEETLAALRKMGIDYVQGFGVGRPEPLNATSAPGRS
jgi:EAL domain-containing protein (putative c-di-GMP-specific phosphodiesterase class I)/PAS domain-containing protein